MYSQKVPFGQTSLYMISEPNILNSEQNTEESASLHSEITLRNPNPLPCLQIQAFFAPLLKPIPFLSSHRLESDLLLYDQAQTNERGEIRGLLSNYNWCKRITNVVFDSLTGLTAVKMESNENIVFTPNEMMINRLESLGEKNAYKLAKKIENLGFFINESRMSCGFNGVGLRKCQRTDPRFRLYQAANKAFYQKNEDNLLIDFQFKFSKKSSGFEVAEIAFNQKFRGYLGFESSSDFSKSLLRKGFPDVIFIEENYHNWYTRMLNNSFGRLLDSRVQKEPMEICIQGKNFEKELMSMDVEMSLVELEGYVEVTMHLVMSPTKSSLKRKKFVERSDQIVRLEKEIEEDKVCENASRNYEFVKKFYPEALVKKRRVEPRECGYRLL